MEAKKERGSRIHGKRNIVITSAAQLYSDILQRLLLVYIAGVFYV
jgi:hypothetical protein